MGTFEKFDKHEAFLEEADLNRKKRQTKFLWILVAVGLVFIGCELLLLRARNTRNATNLETHMCDSLSVGKMASHLKAFDEIARNDASKSRSVGSGHLKSAEYVINELELNGICEPKKQFFKAPIWKNTAPAILQANGINYQFETDFKVLRYGGASANVTGRSMSVSNGCSDDNYAFMKPGTVAMIAISSNCTAWDAAYNAQKYGAVAAIFYNTEDKNVLFNARVRMNEWKEGDPLIGIPCLSAIHSVGMQLVLHPTSVHINTFCEQEIVETFNVLCWVHGSSSDPKWTVIGSHLDSVSAGPGLNDNASGSSFNLELAKTFKLPIKNVLFAWWSAEELGLLGSYHFVRNLDPEDDQIFLNLNFDMLGSPNHVAFVHDSALAPPSASKVSKEIQDQFEKYFNSRNQSFSLSPMNGGSDFLPFIKAGISAGGLLTGAANIKTPYERTTYNGMANAAHDPCYHSSCDTFENVDLEVLYKMSQAGCNVAHNFVYNE